MIVACKGSEDKRCADQWTFLENFEDHYVYLGEEEVDEERRGREGGREGRRKVVGEREK